MGSPRHHHGRSPISSAEACLAPPWASKKVRQMSGGRPIESNMFPALTCPSTVALRRPTVDDPTVPSHSPPCCAVRHRGTNFDLSAPRDRTMFILNTRPDVQTKPPSPAVRIASFHEGIQVGLDKHIILSPHLRKPNLHHHHPWSSGRARRSRLPPNPRPTTIMGETRPSRR